MVHLTLRELFLEFLPGGLAHAGFIEHPEIVIFAIGVAIGFEFAPGSLLLVGKFTIPPDEFGFCL